MGTGKEAEQDRLRMQLLDHIIEAHDDVVTASSLTTGENASNANRCIALENGAILVIDEDLKLWHASGTTSKQGREHLLELITDGELTVSKGHLGVLDVCKTGRCAWHEFVSQLLQLGEGFV